MRKSFFLIIFFLTLEHSAQAVDLFVSKSGNDNNNGSINSPFLTLKKGISTLNLATKGQSHTLFVRQGSYSETLNGLPSGVSWSSPITISGYANETVIINPSGTCEIINFVASQQYIIFKNMILDGTNLFKSLDSGCYNISLRGNYIRFENLEVKNSPWNGIIGSGYNHEFINLKVHHNGYWATQAGYPPGNNGVYLTTNNSLIDGGEYYENSCFGVRFFDSSSTTSANNNIVRNAKIHHNGRGIAFDGTALCGSGGGGIVLGDTNNAAINNIVFNNYWGISTSAGGGRKVTAPLIYNNTLYANSYGLHVDPEAVNAQVINNIFYKTNYNANSGTGTVFSHNLCSPQTTFCTLTAEPNFKDAANLDFHLLPGSPALDKGMTLTQVPTDRDGTLRPQGQAYDIGAHEFISIPATTNKISAPKNLKIK